MLLPNFLSLKAKQEVLQTFMLLQRKETKQEERRQTGSQVEASRDTEDVEYNFSGECCGIIYSLIALK